MRQIDAADVLKHIHERFAESKLTSRVVEAGDVLTSLRERYPEETISIEDIAKYLFSAASIHDVGLVLPGRDAAPAE